MGSYNYIDSMNTLRFMRHKYLNLAGQRREISNQFLKELIVLKNFLKIF
jgi:hypothetical protein